MATRTKPNWMEERIPRIEKTPKCSFADGSASSGRSWSAGTSSSASLWRGGSFRPDEWRQRSHRSWRPVRGCVGCARPRRLDRESEAWSLFGLYVCGREARTGDDHIDEKRIWNWRERYMFYESFGLVRKCDVWEKNDQTNEDNRKSTLGHSGRKAQNPCEWRFVGIYTKFMGGIWV